MTDTPPDVRNRIPDEPDAPPDLRDRTSPGVSFNEPSQESVDAAPPDPDFPLPRAASREQSAALDYAASVGAVSSPKAESQKVLQIARDMGYGPELVSANRAELEQRQKQEAIEYKISQLPQLREYMLRSPYHASAIADEVDKWGTLDYLFGRYVKDPHAQDRAWRIASTGQYEPDRGYYEPPGWLISTGRAYYSTSTSVQTWAKMVFGHGKTEDEIKAQHDIIDQPVPGDNNPVLGTVNNLLGMTPLIAAGMASPHLALAMLYSENSGRAYEGLRLSGYDHETAAPIANMIGFTTGAVAAALGPMFHGEALPVPVKGSLIGLGNAMVVSMTKNPAVWKEFARSAGKNFLANTAMNVAMATSEVAIEEAFSAARENRPFNHSRVASHGAMAADAWAEMMALSVMPAYEQAQRRKALYPAGQEVKAQDAREKMAQTVRENYEVRGRALRSMHAASEIVAAVDAIKDSEFMRTNPRDAKDLIQKMVEPRESQTVYVAPEALRKMSADQLARLGRPDLSLGQSGANVPVNIVDFLMHPDAESLLPYTAGAADLQTLREATGVDLTEPPVRGEDVPDDRLDAWLAAEQARRGQAGGRMPTAQEVLQGTQQAALGNGARRPPPSTSSTPAAPGAVPPVPGAPRGQRALKAWAEDAVVRVPTKEIEGLVEQHEALRDAHAQQALTAQQAATMHAEAGRDPSDAKRMSDDSQHASNVSGAMHKAAVGGVKEVNEIGTALASLASDPPKGQPNARDKAWAAGEVYGRATDAILENLGLTGRPPRGYAAPDLSEVRDHLARSQSLTEDFDVKLLNDHLQAGPVSLADLTLLEAREYMKAVRQISSAVDAENTVRYNGVRVAKAMVFDQLTVHFKNIRDLPPGQRMHADAEAAQAKAGKTKAGLASMFNQPHTLMFKLGKFGEDLYFEQFVPGVARENQLWGDLHPKLRAIEESLAADIRKSGDEVVPNPGGAPERWGIRTRSDVWHLALHLGVSGADVKIAQGLGLKPEALHEWVHMHMGRTVGEAHEVMSKLVEPHWKLFDGLWGEYERHFKERGIAPPEKLKAQPLTVWGKQYSGGYGGRLQWLDPTNNKPILHPGSLEALLGTDPDAPVSPHPHLNERDPYAEGIPLLGWKGVAESMKAEVHDIALRGFVEDAHKIFSDGKIRGLIGDKMSKQALNEIYNPNGEGSWLHVVARGSVADVSSAGALTRGAMKLQGYAAYSAFSLNVKVMLGQLSHLIAAMPGLEINPVHMAMGSAAAFSPERRVLAHRDSQVLSLRYADYQSRTEELNRQMTGVRPGSGDIRKATDSLNWAAWREMDAFLSHAIWEATYAKATAKYQIGGPLPMTHDQAVRYADVAVTKMMPAQDIYDQSAFARDRSVAGLGFLVKNFPNTLLNVAAINLWDARVAGGGATRYAGVAAKYVGMVMAAELLGKGYLMHLGPRDGDDQEQWLKDRVVEGLFYPPMASAPALAAYHAMQGRPRVARDDMTRMMPPSLSVLSQGISDIGSMVLNGDEDAGFRAASHLFGLGVKSPIPGKLYDLYNAGRNASGPADAIQKGMGYRQ